MTLRVVLRLPYLVAILIGLTAAAHAGPLLICHPFEIGQAKSLPMISWNDRTTAGYDLKNLPKDTLVLLDDSTPVLVRMETLRRAAILARHDPQVAKELLTRLHARATASESAGHPDALAWFDVGYLAETYKQWIGRGEPNPATGLNGYEWVNKAIRLRGQDAQMEFASALIIFAGPESARREHLRKAIAGGKNDPLLARNLASSFNGQTMAQLLDSAQTAEVKK